MIIKGDKSTNKNYSDRTNASKFRTEVNVYKWKNPLKPTI
uniref:Uncharacterized protein n=1 Tax=Siphoviridae sp. ctamP19 TaxID=2827896 RepID=A0A8S5TNB8_9CAUD|nr:MAG TPA: hypothetical protein [Siphoviridae sp. ctamP19]